MLMTASADSLVEDVLRQQTPADRLAVLRRSAADDEAGLEALVVQVENRVHSAPVDAERLALTCVTAADARGLPRLVARATYLLARIRGEGGDLAGALRLIASARSSYLDAGDPLQAVRTDLGRMQILDDLGDHRGAIAVGDALLEALASGPEGVDRAEILAAALGNLGVAHSFLGDHDRSLAYYGESESTYLHLGARIQVAQQRANQGIEFLALGRAREAADSLRSARAEFGSEGDPLWAAKCAVHLAAAHEQLGELMESIAVLNLADAELTELGAAAEVVRVNVQHARVYLAAGLYREAIREADKAIDAASEHGMLHDEAFSRLSKATALLGIGDVLAAQREAGTATELFERLGDRQYQARVALLRADLADRSGDGAGTRDVLMTAVADLEEGGWLVPLGWSLLQLHDVSEDPVERAILLHRAERLAEQVGVPDLQQAVVVRRARAASRHGGLDEAIDLLGAAAAEVRDGGLAMPDPALRLAIRSGHTAVFDDLVDALVRRGNPSDVARAARVSDNAKARILMDLIAETVGARRAGASGPDRPRHLDERLEIAKLDLRTAYSALNECTNAPDRSAHLERVRELEAAVRAVTVRSTVGTRPRPARVMAEPSASQDAPPTVSYHCHEDDMIAFVSDQGEVVAHRLVGAVDAVRRLTADLNAQWTRFGFSGGFAERHSRQLLDTTRAVLQELYRHLVEPIMPTLEWRVRAELRVVPHGPAHQVPFHALFDGAQHLGERWAVSVAATIEAGGPQATTGLPIGDVVVLAVPDDRCPAISTEADVLRGLFPQAKVRTGPAATLAELRDLRPGSLVHVACHGLFRADNPLFSAIRMGEGWVTSAEILDLDLRGARVTLSACESGRPGQENSEPVGLAWSFLAAGAAEVIVSQWLVDDTVTLSLMSDLYRRLADGMSPPLALAAAQRAVAAHHPNPYHWAPFVHVTSPSVAFEEAP